MPNLPILPHLTKIKQKHLTIFLSTGVATFFLTSVFLAFTSFQLSSQLSSLTSKNAEAERKLATVTKDYATLKGEDQYLVNQKNLEEIKKINATYKKAVSIYESLVDLKTRSKPPTKFDSLLASSLSKLADKNYASAESELISLEKLVKAESDKLAAANNPATNPGANAPTSNTPPSSGFARQNVTVSGNNYLVDIISADMGSTRIIVDTASDNDCRDNCPVLSLGDYVSRNGAFAGINGSYFCPAEYPSCAGKTNSFDLLAMNKNKHYFNSDNNVYSTNPAVIFQSGSMRFVGRGSEWGRDTGVDGVLMNYPLLVQDRSNVFGGTNDSKMTGKGPRCFVANKGTTAYIGIVYNATMSESAEVLKTLGIENAMNLDEGGSTALWFGGYKAGPGRNIPNAILFIRK